MPNKLLAGVIALLVAGATLGVRGQTPATGAKNDAVVAATAEVLTEMSKLRELPVLSPAKKATKVGVLAFGTTHWPIEEARAVLRGKGVEFDYLRLRAFPFSDAVRDFFAKHDRVYVVEENRDAQMAGMLRMEIPETSEKIRSVLHYDGLPLDADSVVEALLAHETR